MQLYSEILDAGGPAFGSILRHVRDSPNDGFLFHCTGAHPTPLTCLFDYNLLYLTIAGKDRTGIAAALLLLVSVFG
jgi:protein tyrosine/serine phosphatase